MRTLRVLGLWILMVAVALVPMSCILGGDEEGDGDGPSGLITIYTGNGTAMTRSVASDGSRYLVGIQGRNIFGTGGGQIGLQLVNQSGTLEGSLVNVGRTGGAPLLAYGGSKYLVIWGDDAHLPGSDIYGVFAGSNGQLTGPPFPITQGFESDGCDGLASDGTDFLVAYTDTTGIVCGRIVASTGGVGPRIFLSEAPALVDSYQQAAFGGGKYLAAWLGESGHEAQGRLVNPNGSTASEVFTIFTNDEPMRALVVAFGEGKFLVASLGFMQGTQENLCRFVSPDGQLVGDSFSLPGAPVDFDGEHYLILETDITVANNYNVYRHFMDGSGLLVGDRAPVITIPGHQVAGDAAYGGGKYLVAWNDDVTLNPWNSENVYALLVDAE